MHTRKPSFKAFLTYHVYNFKSPRSHSSGNQSNCRVDRLGPHFLTSHFQFIINAVAVLRTHVHCHLAVTPVPPGGKPLQPTCFPNSQPTKILSHPPFPQTILLSLSLISIFLSLLTLILFLSLLPL